MLPPGDQPHTCNHENPMNVTEKNVAVVDKGLVGKWVNPYQVNEGELTCFRSDEVELGAVRTACESECVCERETERERGGSESKIDGGIDIEKSESTRMGCRFDVHLYRTISKVQQHSTKS